MTRKNEWEFSMRNNLNRNKEAPFPPMLHFAIRLPLWKVLFFSCYVLVQQELLILSGQLYNAVRNCVGPDVDYIKVLTVWKFLIYIYLTTCKKCVKKHQHQRNIPRHPFCSRRNHHNHHISHLQHNISHQWGWI